ncbi:hypothetical protein PIB30_042077 [Stylosanthes scabra]|uniref:Uncharacterized protein n=1 Tax=Stylosanthes scabra TaxID=79078 RepID=A0ABU6RF71_9FABA|nr:hypothetical protein [Stylosanthes scabra]
MVIGAPEWKTNASVPATAKGKEKVEVEPLINFTPEVPKEDFREADLEFKEEFLDGEMIGVVSILPIEFAVTPDIPAQNYLDGDYFETGPTDSTITFAKDEGTISFHRPTEH